MGRVGEMFDIVGFKWVVEVDWCVNGINVSEG